MVHDKAFISIKPPSDTLYLWYLVFNRPAVAGAVVQKPLSLINWLSKSSFSSKSSRHLHSKPDDLGIWNLRECSTPSMCHKSHVPWHMSYVTCHVTPSRVICCMSHVTFFFTKWWSYSEEGLLWTKGLHHLVFRLLLLKTVFKVVCV